MNTDKNPHQMNEIKNWPTEADIELALKNGAASYCINGYTGNLSERMFARYGFKAAISWLKSQLQPIKGEGRTYMEGEVDDMIYNAFSAGFYTPTGAKFQPSIDKYIDDLKQKP